MDKLSDIEIFVAVVDCASFTRAAEQLHLSRSLISKELSRLEDRLGARLLQRSTRKLSLTEVGGVFYEKVRRGLEEIAEAEAAVSVLQQEPRGLLRINAPMSFGILHIAPHMADFMQRYPRVQVDLHLDDRKLDVVEDGFDVSVRITNMPDSSLVARKLAPCRHAVVASPDYLKRRGVPLSPQQLTEHRIITYRHQTSNLEWEFRSPKGAGFSVALSSHLQMNNSLALREAVLGGAGIARLPTFVAGKEIKEGRMVALFADHGQLELPIYLVYPERRYLSPKVRAFVDFLAELIHEEPYWENA